jgi:putative endonuclease
MHETTLEWFVYILECRDGKLYTGITNDLAARIAAHNNGTGARFTRGRAPVKLLYHEIAASRSAALKRELSIKRLSRQQKLELVSGYQLKI